MAFRIVYKLGLLNLYHLYYEKGNAEGSGYIHRLNPQHV